MSHALKNKYDYDLVCIGSGPAGQRAAVQAAKLGKSVAVIEKKRVVGGVGVSSAGSRPGGRATFVSAKVAKTIDAPSGLI